MTKRLARRREQAIATALSFKPLEPAKVAALLDRTRELAKNGDYERFKTSEQFDGTRRNPKWLESASI